MDFFVKGKHWQVFLALFGLPIIGIIVFMFSMVLHAEGHVSLTFIAIVIAATIIAALILFAIWFYSLVEALHERLPKGIVMNLTLFKVFLTVPVLFMLRLTVLLFETIPQLPELAKTNPASFAASNPLIGPLFMLATFCMFYCLVFGAKVFKSVELRREVNLDEYLPELFQLWYFPLGVWILQPRINRIFSKN